ncbi:MAG: TatA/E family twin arginine-targeting protein translocase [Leptolyngbyaceae cyanobacterium SM1_1_3]|nr:TatA/E family twin arginine-targeting protein translocase [Leptolyngbyaceae cyanobacterium SM1_1_3]NJN04958.1 TatA/E family twin arginine-targeting protein translocase [Leptolyngbyaceae cyanobacterium RM1_1_2]NJO08716.1 TatA/E family twin arginine-targeting protein translocase [Leptolyngbyaceae cyanobacterium SL_1_1]
MNVFGIGLPEMALIFIVALLVFGPKKLPEIGRSLGKAIRGFQDASKEFETEFKREAERIEKTVSEPMKATLETPQKKALSPQPEASEESEETVAETAESA